MAMACNNGKLKIMTNYEALKKEMLTKPSIKTEYDALAPEFDIIKRIIEGRHLFK